MLPAQAAAAKPAAETPLGLGSAVKLSSMERVLQAQPRLEYRLWLKYSDGVEGEVDLSALVGKGVFAAWLEPGLFDSVRVNEFRAPEWPGDIDLCPDSLCMQLTGNGWAELASGSRTAMSA
jgi:hypothetical protein